MQMGLLAHLSLSLWFRMLLLYPGTSQGKAVREFARSMAEDTIEENGDNACAQLTIEMQESAQGARMGEEDRALVLRSLRKSLHGFQSLRNELEHRLGDADATQSRKLTNNATYIHVYYSTSVDYNNRSSSSTLSLFASVPRPNQINDCREGGISKRASL